MQWPAKQGRIATRLSPVLCSFIKRLEQDIPEQVLTMIEAGRVAITEYALMQKAGLASDAHAVTTAHAPLYYDSLSCRLERIKCPTGRQTG